MISKTLVAISIILSMSCTESLNSWDGSANSTLAIYTEQLPEATATFTQTHRVKVWWNNAEYWMSLDAV